MRRNGSRAFIAAAVVTQFVAGASALAALSFNVDANGWPSATHRDAAVAAMTSVVARYNAYGDFGNANVYVYYNSGIPTAQANYLGSIGFGGTYPNERVTMHELAHYLGSGTYGDPWDGQRGEALVDQFDGLEASLNGDTQHFWPYGLNYDSEGAEINKQRQVALTYAQRADMGIGNTAIPGTATSVQLTASDALGESGFNYASTWSDTRFARSTAAYSTGQFTLRTPASANSFAFAGNSLTINNTNGINGGLLYKGSGSTGTLTFRNLNVDGGYIRHASSSADVARIAGRMTLTGTATVDAAQGPIVITSNIDGTGSLTKAGSFQVQLTGTNTYTGNTTVNAGILRLAPISAVATYTFDSVTGSIVTNTGFGGAAMNGTLANGAAVVTGGQTGNAVSLSGGASVDINSPVADLGNDDFWTVAAWVKTTTPGASILSKGNGGWANGNTVFYLGDGTGPGSGGVPSSVRYAGGFLQGAAGARSVIDGAWHHVAYVNNAGSYAIYVDGVLQTLSTGNLSFSNGDVSSLLRLGVTTNGVASDGTVNFSGLLDNVQIFNQALSAAQITSVVAGATHLGSLPSSTNVTIASGATLDLNGATQQIGSLAGVAGSNLSLGAGRLTVNSPASTQFAGLISGTGSLVKQGAGTLTLTGTNSYTGGTTVQAGTLVIGNSARTPVLASNGTDLRGGTLVFDYTGGTTPAAQVLALLDAGFDQATKFSAGALRNTLLPAGQLLGWTDDTLSKRVTVRTTLAGDANLDLTVNFDDLLVLAANYNGSATWGGGDFNYDGAVNFDDLLALAANYNATIPAGGAWALAAAVPEPTAIGALMICSAVTLRRTTRIIRARR
jgi:autotransporter-associated beta strand protein